ncbi:hypothetical protein AB833_05640 [Chromatiales bacterium (ex Bugula neritina AB1)]|nr:hypothetical protein AB833_05640 [Chromatiales bacterium (ex Bugula neritina AB1)]
MELAGVTDIDDSTLGELVSNLKLVIDNRDALYVAGTDPSELETVRRNFVVKKLNVTDTDKGNLAVAEVAKKMASSRMKNRAAFYYLVKQQLA